MNQHKLIILQIDRATRFILELKCSKKDRYIFKTAMEALYNASTFCIGGGIAHIQNRTRHTGKTSPLPPPSFP